ncbi:MAG: beta-lactamase family protein, partial [Spirochaetales bacterium]|nr:beta-lactamase family protein [Spirochaetales bacterium]
MKLLVRLLSLLLIVTWTCSCVSLETVETQRYQKTIQAAQETGTNLIVQMSDVTAVSIAVMHEGTIIHSEGFGKRDIEQDLSVDKHTHFNIGSISK